MALGGLYSLSETYPSTIATLGRLTLEFPWILGFKDLGGLNLPVPDKKQSVSRHHPPRHISADMFAFHESSSLPIVTLPATIIL